jgi:hypothetical protein
MYKKIGTIVMGAIAMASLYPSTTHAQTSSGGSSLAAGAASCAVGTYVASQLTSLVSGLFSSSDSSSAVPTNSAYENQKLAKQESKNFTLDRLASCAAKQLLHQITADTVSWINSGFKGGPAFLQNPRGFLLNSADQLTGAFISDSGLLQGLCSPWNIDLRLTLALETSHNGSFNNAQYACTLSKIVGQAKNASIDGFINGDFKQGGWNAFMDMTVGSDNPAAQYLIAKSGIQSAINQKTQEINNDLAQGMGFLSSEKCTPVTEDQIGQINAGEIFEGVDFDYENGTYEQCVKTTPGSYIAHALNVHTDSGIVESEMANDINAVTSALFTQLTNQLLQKGLSSLSGSGSSVHVTGSSNLNTFVNQLQVAAYSPQTVNAADGSTYTVQNGSVAQTATNSDNPILNAYAQALSTLNATKSLYIGARDCFALIVSSGGANAGQAASNRTTIENIITRSVDPIIASTTNAQGFAQMTMSSTNADLAKAQAALTTAQSTSAQLNQGANQYMNACENMNNNGGTIDNGQ